MRAIWVAVLIAATGCASTVTRLPGDVPTRTGQPRGECESRSWLVVAPTRSEEPSESGRTSAPRDDGLGLYRVGAAEPESIPALAPELGESEMVARHQRGVERHDRKRWVAAGLGAAGLVALGIGTYLFASSFDTVRKTQSDGSVDEEQEIKGGRIAAGSILIAVGFGLGIGGIVASPSSAERAKADQTRYVFLPPVEDQARVTQLVGAHNQRVRDRCFR